MGVAARAPTFSVIVPMESSFGLALECLAAWTQRIDFPRERYHLIVAVPESMPPRDFREVQASLGPHDRVLRLPVHHDIPLVAAAARIAHGDALFFTESHCVPEPDVLTIADSGLAAHPEWSGFSMNPKRRVTSRLAALEAEMYDADRETGMGPDHWRRIHDACFVVRREAYVASGGFDPTLGHFAEWMLAAHFRRVGLTLGYLPEGEVQHVYAGDLAHWHSFTADFVRGEMLAYARGDADQFADLFAVVPEWASRLNWSSTAARGLFRICVQDALTHSTSGALAARWLPAAVGGMRLGRLRAEARAAMAYGRARVATRVAALDTLRGAVHTSLGARTHAERLRVLSGWLAARAALPTQPRVPHGSWSPRRGAALPCAGFVASEHCAEDAMWTEPAALVLLPLPPGSYVVTIVWAPLMGTIDPAPRFFLNERAIDAEAGPAGPTSRRLRVEVDAAGEARLAWICRPHRASRHERRLGLPVTQIAWQPTHVPIASPAHAVANRAAT